MASFPISHCIPTSFLLWGHSIICIFLHNSNQRREERRPDNTVNYRKKWRKSIESWLREEEICEQQQEQTVVAALFLCCLLKHVFSPVSLWLSLDCNSCHRSDEKVLTIKENDWVLYDFFKNTYILIVVFVLLSILGRRRTGEEHYHPLQIQWFQTSTDGSCYGSNIRKPVITVG